IDVMFDNEAAYRRVRDNEVINRAGIARIYGRDPADIIVVNHDAALAIKVSFPRPQSSGSKYDSDVYGGLHYAPLLSLPAPDCPVSRLAGEGFLPRQVRVAAAVELVVGIAHRLGPSLAEHDLEIHRLQALVLEAVDNPRRTGDAFPRPQAPPQLPPAF